MKYSGKAVCKQLVNVLKVSMLEKCQREYKWFKIIWVTKGVRMRRRRYYSFYVAQGVVNVKDMRETKMVGENSKILGGQRSFRVRLD